MRKLLFVLAWAAAGWAQEPTAAAKKPEADPTKATLAGTVVDSLTGKPVKDVSLLLAGGKNALAPTTAKSDEAGVFNFKNVEPGSYVLMADHPRYARQTYGSRNGLMGGTMLTLTAGQSLAKLEFKLQSNAIASGRVLDEDGDPLSGFMVAALRPAYLRGKRQFLPLGTGISNDLGEFRIANLAAGRYFLVAFTMNQAKAVTKASDGTESVYTATYYPNLTDVVGAGQVEVNAGRDVAGLDIRMAKAKSVRIKGRVAGLAENQKAQVRLVPQGAGLMAMLMGRTAQLKMPEGTFELAGASRGVYELQAMDPSGMARALSTPLKVEVGERNIDGVQLDVLPAAELSGVLAMKGEKKEPLKGARLMLESADTVVMMPPMASLGDDGTFTFKNLTPGKYFVRLMGGPEQGFIESVSLGNVQSGEDGIQLGSVPGKLEVKLNAGGAAVDGAVKGGDDNPMAGATVALIPSTREYLRYQTALTDQNGAFNFKAVPPGEYKVIAWEEVEPNAYQDPEFLKPFEGKGEKVSLKESEHRSVTLKAIPRQ